MRFGGYAGLPAESLEVIDKRREGARAVLSKYTWKTKDFRRFRGSETYTVVVEDHTPEVTSAVVLYAVACSAFGSECVYRGDGEFSVEVYTS